MKWWVPVSLVAVALAMGFGGMEWSARRSEREWTEFRAKWEARGEAFGVAANLPPARAESEEFAAHPWMRGLAAGDPAILARLAGMVPASIEGFDDWQGSADENEVLPTMPDDLAARVRQRGEAFKAELDEYSAAMERPGNFVASASDSSDFGDSAWIAKLSAVPKLLDALSHAALAEDDAEEFTRLATLELRAGEKLRATNVTLATVVGAGCEAGARVAILTAEASGKWPAERAKWLAALEVRTRPVADEFTADLRIERGRMLETIETLERTGSSPDSIPLSSLGAVRRKFFADAKSALCQEFQESVLADSGKLASTIDPAKLKRFMDAVGSRKKEPPAEGFGHLPYFLTRGILDSLTLMETDREELCAKLAGKSK
jgi:hypothetical protein